MITRETINKELGEIKYFNSRREMFDKAFDSVGKNTVLAAIGKYNTAICNASPKLYEVYVTLFIEGCTYEEAAEKLCYSSKYIYKFKRILVDYFFRELNKEDAQ